MNSVTLRGPISAQKSLERAALLGNRHREQRLALLAELGPLGDEAQAVEVHVGAAGDGHEGLALDLAPLDVLLDAPPRRARRRARGCVRVSWNTSLIAAHTASVSTITKSSTNCAREAEGLFADQLDRGAVGEQAHFGQLDALAGTHRARHRVGIARLHADDAHLGTHRLDVGRDAGDQAAAADGDEHRVERALVLAQDLHADRALPGDHVRVVERMHESQPRACARSSTACP